MMPVRRSESVLNQLGDGERRIVRTIRDEGVREGVFRRRKGGEKRRDDAFRLEPW